MIRSAFVVKLSGFEQISRWAFLALSMQQVSAKRAAGTPARGAARVECRDRLGGVIHEYVLAA